MRPLFHPYLLPILIIALVSLSPQSACYKLDSPSEKPTTKLPPATPPKGPSFEKLKVECQNFWAQKNLKKAHDRCRLAIQINPQGHESRLILAKVYLEMGERSYATTQLELIIKRAPENAPSRAWAWYWLGRVAQDRQLEDQAKTFFAKALELAKKIPDADLESQANQALGGS